MNNKNSKENFENTVSPTYHIAYIFQLITALFALYLSFKCNRGIDIGSLIVAICCPVLYIVYKYATSPNFCA
jgi:hypothetical protein